MMRFGTQARAPARESVVPMINVVFLLLIFFLMSATLSGPDPFDLTTPEARAEAAPGEAEVLYLSASGERAFGSFRGEAAVNAAASGSGALLIRADRAVPATEVAALLARLSPGGARDISIEVRPR